MINLVYEVFLLYSTFVIWIGYTDGQRKPRAETSEMRLLDFLFVKSGYTTDMRPVYDEVDVTNLTIAINQFSVLTVDTSEEIVSLSIEFLITWRDEFLTWDPDEFNITVMKVKETSVWVPDVVVSTSISRTLLLDQSERYVDLTNEGFVTMSMYGIFENICKMQVDEFPFDQQTALINIGPWSYRSQQISVTALQPINWDRYKGNSEWDLLGFNATTIQTTDSDISFVYDEAVFTFTVKRRPQFYVWVLLIPTLIITIVSIFGLFIPTNTLGEREERVNLGLTTLLSNSVILEIVAGTMPKTSSLPILGDFILAEIFVTAIGVLCSVLVLTLHNRAITRGWAVPRCVKTCLRLPMLKRRKKVLLKGKKLSTNSNCQSESDFSKDVLLALGRVEQWISTQEEEEKRAILWTRFFDRIDLFLLIFFQVGNAIVTICLV